MAFLIITVLGTVTVSPMTNQASQALNQVAYQGGNANVCAISNQPIQQSGADNYLRYRN